MGFFLFFKYAPTTAIHTENYAHPLRVKTTSTLYIQNTRLSTWKLVVAERKMSCCYWFMVAQLI